MRYSLSDGTLNDQKSPCLVTTFKTAKSVARANGFSAELNTAARDFKDDADQTLCLQAAGDIARILVIGGGDGTLEPDAFRKLARTASQALIRIPVKQALLAFEHVKVRGKKLPWMLKILTSAMTAQAYRYTRHKSAPDEAPTLTTVKLLVQNKTPVAFTARLANALDKGMTLTRDLGNEPPNVCNPGFLLREARKLARKPDVSVTDLTERKIKELGMGAFMAVTQGSDTPGHMIVVRYNGGKRGDAPYALVGKGITFDTGGISLKPPPAMDEMKFDMCGAAAVLGVTRAVIEAKLPINLITIVAAAENMPSGKASRPGDIVKTASGKTVEILNTDAEGRLVLCDALTHAQTFNPQVIVDVATLTGAQIVALGSQASALYANDDDLAQALLTAGDDTGDRAWRMPLWDEYQSALRSNFADVANVGGREAGSVTAACFLARFIEDVKWAHMDVAGSAFSGGARKGATGRPVPLLFAYLCGACGAG